MSGAETRDGLHGALQTEFAFTLPQGYSDDEGTLHREGTMRLATAADEILPLKDPRVQANPSYLTVVLLSRVVTRLGSLSEVTPHVIEGLFVADVAHLQELYERVNVRGADSVDAVCPDCGEAFEVALDHAPGAPGFEEEASADPTPEASDRTGVMEGNPGPGLGLGGGVEFDDWSGDP